MDLWPARALSTRIRRGLILGAVLCTAAAGCGPPRQAPYVSREAAAARLDIGADLPANAGVDSLIAPFRRAMNAQMGEVLAHCPVAMETGNPEGNLGALISDMVLARARGESDLPVAACVLNNGGFRIPWSPGPITLGLVYEVMPFDNEMVLMRLTADQVRLLADQLAARNGEPVADLSFTIRAGRAADLLVRGAPVGSADYWIVTNSYLSGGGGGMPVLWEPQETRHTGVLIRDAIVDAVRSYGAAGKPGSLPMPRMGRIRAVDP